MVLSRLTIGHRPDMRLQYSQCLVDDLDQTRHIFWRRGLEAHRVAGPRVDEAEASGVQGLPRKVEKMAAERLFDGARSGRAPRFAETSWRVRSG